MSFNFKNYDNGEEAGREYAKAFEVGMSEESYRAITSMENVYVELESLTKNAAKNAEKLQKKRQERRLDNLKNALELELICEQEYYEQLKVFRDQNLKQGTDAWYKCTEEIAEYNSRMLKEAEEQYDKILSLREELAQKLMKGDSWATDTRTTFKGMGKNGADLVYEETALADLREEVILLENYRDRLTELKNLGDVPEGIFADIGSMSAEKGLKAVNAILDADETSRTEFFSAYRDRNTAAQEASADLLGLLYADRIRESGLEDALRRFEKTNGRTEDYTEVLKASFENVPESYLELGSESGEAFGKGFLASVPQLMEEVRAEFLSAINELGAQITVSLRQDAQAAAEHTSNTYNNTYTFNHSADTTSRQLSAARSAAALERLRGGNA